MSDKLTPPMSELEAAIEVVIQSAWERGRMGQVCGASTVARKQLSAEIQKLRECRKEHVDWHEVNDVW